MEFELPPEYQMIKDTVQRFVREELMPLEPGVLAREAKERNFNRGITNNRM